MKEKSLLLIRNGVGNLRLYFSSDIFGNNFFFEQQLKKSEKTEGENRLGYILWMLQYVSYCGVVPRAYLHIVCLFLEVCLFQQKIKNYR